MLRNVTKMMYNTKVILENCRIAKCDTQWIESRRIRKGYKLWD